MHLLKRSLPNTNVVRLLLIQSTLHLKKKLYNEPKFGLTIIAQMVLQQMATANALLKLTNALRYTPLPLSSIQALYTV